MTSITKTLKFFENRRKQALKNGYKKPKVILVDIDGTVIKPKVKMYSMAEEKLGKKAVNELEKNKRNLRKRMIKREISFEKYLIELSRIDIKLGEYLKDYKNFFFGLVKKNLVNIPLVKALGNLSKKDKMKVIFVTSNIKDYGKIISDNVLSLIGKKGKFDDVVGSEYKFNKAGKAIKVKTLISHENASCEGVRFFTKETAIKEFFRKNKIKIDKEEVAVISDADTALMMYYGLGGLVYYPWNELSNQFKEIEYIRNARKGLYDFRVDYSKGTDLDIAQQKWEEILRNPNLIEYSEEELRKMLKTKKKNE